MSSSLIFQRFSEYLENPEVLTTPQEYLGLHYKKVLDFWNRIENLTEEQWRVVNERYLAFRNERFPAFYNKKYSEWRKVVELARYASEEVLDFGYAYWASWAAEDVTNSWAADWATLELIGGVENPTFLPMFDNL